MGYLSLQQSPSREQHPPQRTGKPEPLAETSKRPRLHRPPHEDPRGAEATLR